MIELFLYIIGFEGIVMAVLMPMWNAECLMHSGKYLELGSIFCGFGGLTGYYYITGYEELAMMCGLFWALSGILIIYVLFIQKKQEKYVIDIPEGSYEIIMDDPRPTAQSQPNYRLIFNGEIYTIAVPVISGKPALKLIVTEDAKAKFRFADVIVKGQKHKTIKDRIHQAIFVIYNVLAICAPFLCLWFNSSDKTAKYVIFLMFGYGTCVLKDAKSVLHKLIYYFSILISISMFIAVFLQ